MKLGKLILLVDDDPIVNYLNVRLLKDLEFVEEIKVCFNGNEAMQVIIQLHKEIKRLPDLILLDISMPVLNGFEFLEAFKELSIPNKENIKLIFISNSSASSDLEKIQSYGYEIIDKPLTKEKIYSIFKE